MTFMPFICDHRQSPSGDISGLVAREYFEWTWKSAIYFIVDYKECGAEMKIKAGRKKKNAGPVRK
jgi:hypothetical protein